MKRGFRSEDSEEKLKAKIAVLQAAANAITVYPLDDVEALHTANQEKLIAAKKANPLYKEAIYKSKTLDSLYNQNIINNIGFIHLDVEGMEYKIILGSLNLIEKERPIVSYEGHTHTDTYLNDIKKYFIEKNYSIFRIEEACGRDDCRNFLAIPNDINNNINLNDMYSNLNIDNTIFIQVS